MKKVSNWILICLMGSGLLVVFNGCAGRSKHDPPVVTDEFDRFLVTKATQIGDVIGRIELVFPNSKKITWSLIPPVPGADRRNYLKEGQLDATEIVEIDPRTGQIRLKAHPSRYPAHYYAEVRATNADGFMDQVLIIIALEEAPEREHALDIFTQRAKGSGIAFFATAGVDPKKLEYAAKVAEALLSKDRRGPGKITRYLKEKNIGMTLFKTFEERNTSIGFYMHIRSLGIKTQDLEDEEIIPDYVRLGGPADLRRDASVEEITHLIHEGGIMEAYPEVQARLEKATQSAIDRKLFRPWDGLPADSFSQEYLAIGLDIYYGVRRNQLYMGRIQDENGNPIQPAYRLSVNNDVLMTAENLKRYDSELYEIVSFLFPTREEFFKEMGWEEDRDADVRFTKQVEVFGLYIYATNTTRDDKLLHAANVLAEYIDNDEDGVPDNPKIMKALTEGKGAIVMRRTERERPTGPHPRGQGLYDEETIPNGRDQGRFDASLEEILHMVTDVGWAGAYPEVFNRVPGTQITNALDIARGARFLEVPEQYPEGAWFTYDDKTCDYDCMTSEYIYWALTSILGGQDYPGRLEQIGREWRLNTREKVKERDVAVYAILTNPEYKLPRVLPDGQYKAKTFTIQPYRHQ
jgi:hypothetical protein